MRRKHAGLQVLTTLLILAALATLRAIPASAHCDGLDGPVVGAAREALARRDVNLVLIWVRQPDEAEIRAAFERTLKVRALGPEAQQLADMYFFETLVRVHRAGEGAPYTGLKPAGRDLGPAIPAADKALETKNIAPLVNLLSDSLRSGLKERFEHLLAASSYASANVEAGREFVEAYVTFIHYVEAIYDATTRPPSGHYAEEPTTEHHE